MGQPFKTPVRMRLEDKLKEEMELVEDAAKRARSDLLNKTPVENPSSPRTLPSINLDEKKAILTKLGLKNINRIGNLHNVLRRANLE